MNFLISFTIGGKTVAKIKPTNNAFAPTTSAVPIKGAKARSPAASPKPATTLNKPPRKPPPVFGPCFSSPASLISLGSGGAP